MIDRREFLKHSAVAAAGIGGASALLAACGGSNNAAPASVATLGPGTIALPRQDSPVTLPIFEDNPAISRDMSLEVGPLKIYQWKSYLYEEILDDFRARYDVELIVEDFTDMEEAVAKIRDGEMADFDVFFPSIGYLGPMVHERLVMPLNHQLLPNGKTLWPWFWDPDGPFYDVHQRYTVPYTIYGTGIAWRKDLLDRRAWPTELADPYDAFWKPGVAGPRVGFYDDYREALAMALLRNGVEDVNCSNPDDLAAAADSLVELGDAGATRGDDGAYEGIPEGTYKLHQAWSGDILSASSGKRYTDQASEIGFMWPKAGVMGADLTAVLAGGSNPALAHAFVDFLMEPEVAWKNYSWNGYQPPVITSHLETDWSPPIPSLQLTQSDLESGRWLCPLEPQVDAIWHDAWSRVSAVTEPQEEHED